MTVSLDITPEELSGSQVQDSRIQRLCKVSGELRIRPEGKTRALCSDAEAAAEELMVSVHDGLGCLTLEEHALPELEVDEHP
jgi:hypothetical protein